LTTNKQDIKHHYNICSLQGSVQQKVLELRHALDIVENSCDVGGIEVLDIYAELTNKMYAHGLDQAFAQDEIRLTDR
jgi:hypothetical protein